MIFGTIFVRHKMSPLKKKLSQTYEKVGRNPCHSFGSNSMNQDQGQSYQLPHIDENLFTISPQRYLAANRNHSKDGNSRCQNANNLLNKGCNLMHLYNLSVAGSIWIYLKPGKVMTSAASFTQQQIQYNCHGIYAYIHIQYVIHYILLFNECITHPLSITLRSNMHQTKLFSWIFL